jgi:hypothetical protein
VDGEVEEHDGPEEEEVGLRGCNGIPTRGRYGGCPSTRIISLYYIARKNNTLNE